MWFVGFDLLLLCSPATLILLPSPEQKAELCTWGDSSARLVLKNRNGAQLMTGGMKRHEGEQVWATGGFQASKADCCRVEMRSGLW